MDGSTPATFDLNVEALADAGHLALGDPRLDPSAWTRASTLRVDVPVTNASITTAHNAWSIRRRGSSSDGKKVPSRSFGMRRDTSPALVDNNLGLLPLRCVTRSSVRS